MYSKQNREDFLSAPLNSKCPLAAEWMCVEDLCACASCSVVGKGLEEAVCSLSQWQGGHWTWW